MSVLCRLRETIDRRCKRPDLWQLQNARLPVVFLANGLGDSLLALPAIRAFAELFPARLGLVCTPEIAETFYSEIPFRVIVEICVALEPGGPTFSVHDTRHQIGDCDLIVSLNSWHSAEVVQLLRLLKPAQSVGFFRDFDYYMELDFSKHAADLMFDAPQLIRSSINIADFVNPPQLSGEAIALSRRVRDTLPLGCRILVAHFHTQKEKMWIPTRIAKALTRFINCHPEFFVLHVGDADPQFDFGIVNKRVIPCFGLPLITSIGLVACADLFFGIDSVMLHVSDFFRVPGVGLFGPTSAEEFGFRFAKHRHVQAHGKMADITVDEAVEALNALADDVTELIQPMS